MNLKKIPVLVLNASFEAITIIPAYRALILVSKGAAYVQVPTSMKAHKLIYVPSVIRLLHFAKIPYRRPIPSRRNIFNRDQNHCMYCGTKPTQDNVLELEHILPRSRGGLSVWENLVASCHRCNQAKGDKTPEEANMQLLHRPIPATVHTSRFMLKTLGKEVEAWSPFLWTDNAGDKRFQHVH